MSDQLYTEGEYLDKNPSWHVEDSPWKAAHVQEMMRRHGLQPSTVAEVGCGAGEILRIMRDSGPAGTEYVGYEVSPQAFALTEGRGGDRLRFELADVTQDPDAAFDLVLIMDVIEHVEDPFGFLRALAPKCRHMILHIPLDLSALSAARPHVLLESRAEVGHIHYWQRDTALAVVRDAGLEVVDDFYTQSAADPASTKDKVLAGARKALWKIDPHLSSRLLGGTSLLVLARGTLP